MKTEALRYGIAVFLVLITVPAMAMEVAAVSVEDHLESVAPLIERGELSKGSLARAVFAKRVVDRTPVDELTTLTADVERIYFYTELENMADHTATHRWEYDGQVVSEIKFNVTSAHWRVWSYKSLAPGATGTLTVKVLNAVGDVIGEKTLAPEVMQ